MRSGFRQNRSLCKSGGYLLNTLLALLLAWPALATQALKLTPALRQEMAQAHKHLVAQTSAVNFVCDLKTALLQQVDDSGMGFAFATVTFYQSGFVKVQMSHQSSYSYILNSQKELVLFELEDQLSPGYIDSYADFFFGPYVYESSDTSEPAAPDNVHTESLYPRKQASPNATEAWEHGAPLARKIIALAEKPGSCESVSQ